MRPFFDMSPTNCTLGCPNGRTTARRRSLASSSPLLPGSNTIIIDIARPRPGNADRFVVAYRTDRLPATIVAKVGTLTTTVRETTFDTCGSVTALDA